MDIEDFGEKGEQAELYNHPSASYDVKFYPSFQFLKH
jgi:hypothetical protein